jgi:uncharacterized DUF497 family protein
MTVIEIFRENMSASSKLRTSRRQLPNQNKTITILLPMRFIWDEEKNLANIKKHGVGFDEAAAACLDPGCVRIFDETHSIFEDRWILLGRAVETVLFVVETEPEEDIVRIISARPATKKEEERYYGYGS